jgi:hypothetical protein
MHEFPYPFSDNQGILVHTLHYQHKSHKSQLQDVLTNEDAKDIYHYQRYQIKADMILKQLTADEVFERIDVQLLKGLAHRELILSPKIPKKQMIRLPDSDGLKSYLVVGTEGVSRVCFSFSSYFKPENEKYHTKLSVKLSNDVTEFGLLGFSQSGGSEKFARLATYAIKKAEIFEMSAILDFATKNWTGIGISNFQVPLGTQIDIVAVELIKV